MSEATSAQPEQLRIRTMQDIFEALRSADPKVRFSILQAIIRNPEKAAAYGTADGADLLDELCQHARNIPESPLRTLVLGALVAYQDDRVLEIFLREMNVSNNAESLTLAESYLSGEAEERVKPAISGLIFQRNATNRSRAVADVMHTYEHLSSRERVRVTILSTKAITLPNLDSTTEDAWLAELQGPYADRARRIVETLGEAAFLYLRQKWDRLGDENKSWLLGWGAARHPAYAVEPILFGLDSNSDLLVLAALEAITQMGEYGKIFATHTGRFLKSPNPSVRCAAAKAGATGVDWEAALFAEDNALVKIEMATRLTEDKGAAAVPTLIQLIEAGDYRVSAAATTALKTLGKDVAEQIKPLISHPDQGVQVAAAQVLIAAGEELWLEEQLLA